MRSRSFALELYPEDETHVDKLEYIKNFWEYAYILHDKDLWEEDIIDETTGEIKHKMGELKKPHWHVIIVFKNPRSIESIQKELDLKHVETCNFYAYARYLIHKDQPQKYPYKKEEIQTNIQLRIDNAIKKNYNAVEQDSRILLDHIFNPNNSILTFRQLTEYAMQNDCLIELKKNSYFYKSFCDDFGFRRF